MKSIKIFISDIKKILYSPVTAIIMIGLMVLPSLYAWINIYASWDPYGNTGNLKVAVISDDIGYNLDLFGEQTDINIGDNVVDGLRSNDKLGWILDLGKEEAMKDLETGKVYAVIVIPQNFSRDMVSVVESNVTKPELEYYINEKLNPIASKITDAGANAIKAEIQTEFIETIASKVVDTAQQAGIDLDENYEKIEEYKDLILTLNDRIPDVDDSIDNVIKETKKDFNHLNKQSKDLDNIKALVDDLQELNRLNKENLQVANTTINTSTDNLRDSIDKIDIMLGDVILDIDYVKRELADAQHDVKMDTMYLQYDLNNVRDANNRMRGRLEDLSKQLDAKATSVGNSISDLDEHTRNMLEEAQKHIEKANVLINAIGKASGKLNQIGSENIIKAIDELNKAKPLLDEAVKFLANSGAKPTEDVVKKIVKLAIVNKKLTSSPRIERRYKDDLIQKVKDKFPFVSDETAEKIADQVIKAGTVLYSQSMRDMLSKEVKIRYRAKEAEIQNVLTKQKEDLTNAGAAYAKDTGNPNKQAAVNNAANALANTIVNSLIPDNTKTPDSLIQKDIMNATFDKMSRIQGAPTLFTDTEIKALNEALNDNNDKNEAVVKITKKAVVDKIVPLLMTQGNTNFQDVLANSKPNNKEVDKIIDSYFSAEDDYKKYEQFLQAAMNDGYISGLIINDVNKAIEVSNIFLDETAPEITKKINDLSKAVDEVSNALSDMKITPESSSIGKILADLQNIKEEAQTTSALIRGNSILAKNEIVKQSNVLDASLDRMISSVNKWGNKFADDTKTAEILDQIADASQDARLSLKIIRNRLDTDTYQKLGDYIVSFYNINSTTNRVLKSVQSELSFLTEKMDYLYSKKDWTVEKLEKLQENIPEMTSGIKEAAKKIKEVDKDVDLKELIKELLSDGTDKIEFMAEPVQLNKKAIFPIENYGAGMTPFYTVLCLWVGCMLMTALMSTSANNADFEFTPYQEYIGKFLLFWVVGLIQATIVALGDMYVLKVHIEDKRLFVLVTLYTITVFTMIVYTLVSLFGNVGKAIGVILLVLQVAGSGGTFPIQVTPPFFRNIHGALPFTYAIGAMRESIGGVTYANLQHDIHVLAGFFFGFFIVGLLLKRFSNKYLILFQEKLAESKIMGH